MSFLIFIGVAALCYLAWRIMDLLPDAIFRLSEIQRDIADIRRTLTENGPAPQEEEEEDAEPSAGESSATDDA
ncbi:MAG: hypothetical protein OXI90_17845 [Gammaproteobacteria bacterium]|nr:hypothetical protein [Gammaproteobacteria bacterium]